MDRVFIITGLWMRFYGIEMSISHTWEITHCGMLFWEDTFMGKRLISLILAVAVIAGFAVVCSAAATKTKRITGSYGSWTETCSYNSDANADTVTLGAEGIRGNKSLGAKTRTWSNDAAVFNHSVSYFNLLSTRGYFTGYYKVGKTMYYNQGYN